LGTLKLHPSLIIYFAVHISSVWIIDDDRIFLHKATKFWDTTDFCMKLFKAEWEVNQEEDVKNANATWFGKWWWACCIETGSWGQSWVETQRKDVKNLLYCRSLLTEYWVSDVLLTVCPEKMDANFSLVTMIVTWKLLQI